MQEELTTKMHAEFGVDAQTEIKHKVWDAMQAIEKPAELRILIERWGVTVEQFNQYCKTYPAEHPLKEKGLQ